MTTNELLREQIRWLTGLMRSMEESVRTDSAVGIGHHDAFKVFARKYNQIVTEIAKTTALPPFIDLYDLDKLGTGGSTLPYQRKEVFDGVYSNASMLRAYLEGKLGVVDDETAALRDFLQSRTRAAVIRPPTSERDVQDAIEQLLIGRGLQKGESYDREVGRVKISAKEVIPDFIFPKLSLGLDVKFVGTQSRVGPAIDEINADITSYSKSYRRLFFVVYDMGFIRDEAEFRADLERSGDVSVILVKN